MGFHPPLYCATDEEDFRRFIRAENRTEALKWFALPTDMLKRR